MDGGAGFNRVEANMVLVSAHHRDFRDGLPGMKDTAQHGGGNFALKRWSGYSANPPSSPTTKSKTLSNYHRFAAR